MNKPQPNTAVSFGTLRSEDLITGFSIALACYAPDQLAAIEEEYSDVYEYLREHGDFWEADADMLESADYLVNESLFDALDAISPEGCYFGTLEGDGSCFGWWECDDEDEDKDEDE